MIILTLAGRFVAWLAGSTFRRPLWDGAEAWPIPNTSWLYRWFFEKFHVAAFTWGAAIIVREELLFDSDLLEHELVHVEQGRKYGIALPIVYLWCSLRAVLAGGSWYRDNALEVEARQRAGR